MRYRRESQEERYRSRRPTRFPQSSAPPVTNRPFAAAVACVAEIVGEPVEWLRGDVIPQDDEVVQASFPARIECYETEAELSRFEDDEFLD